MLINYYEYSSQNVAKYFSFSTPSALKCEEQLLHPNQARYLKFYQRILSDLVLINYDGYLSQNVAECLLFPT